MTTNGKAATAPTDEELDETLAIVGARHALICKGAEWFRCGTCECGRLRVVVCGVCDRTVLVMGRYGNTCDHDRPAA
jgi:hypothetical protein